MREHKLGLAIQAFFSIYLFVYFIRGRFSSLQIANYGHASQRLENANSTF